MLNSLLSISDVKSVSMATEEQPKELEGTSTADSALDTTSVVTGTTTEGSKFSEVSQQTTQYV